MKHRGFWGAGFGPGGLTPKFRAFRRRVDRLSLDLLIVGLVIRRSPCLMMVIMIVVDGGWFAHFAVTGSCGTRSSSRSGRT